MIRFKSNSLLIPLLVALFCAGASSCRHLIFEDRTDCPAFLLFDLTNGDELDVSEYAFVTAYQYPDNNLLASDTTTVKSIQNKEFYLKVKHTDTAIGYGVLRFNGAHNEGSCWTVAPGKDFPPIWRFNYRSPAATESYIIPVEAVKDHSVMTVRFTDPDFFDGTGGEFPFFIIARSNTCGIDGMDGIPSRVSSTSLLQNLRRVLSASPYHASTTVRFIWRFGDVKGSGRKAEW